MRYFEKNEKISGLSVGDFWQALVVGEVIALLTLPTLINFKALNFILFILPDNALIPFLLLGLWLTLLPLSALATLYLLYSFLGKWSPIFFQLGKFALIGALSTLLGLAVFNLLILVSGVARGLVVNLFAIIAFISSATNSFLWNKFWTFRHHERDNIKREYLKFFTISGFLTIINLGIIHTGINVRGAPAGFDTELWANIVFILTIPISFFGNFFGYRMFVFRPRRRNQCKE